MLEQSPGQNRRSTTSILLRRETEKQYQGRLEHRVAFELSAAAWPHHLVLVVLRDPGSPRGEQRRPPVAESLPALLPANSLT